MYSAYGRNIAKKYAPRYAQQNRLFHNMNGNGNGTENPEILKGVKGNISLIFTTLGLVGGGGVGLIHIIRGEIKEALKPLETKIDMMDKRLERLENHFYKFSEDMGHIKALLTK
ncbi:4660_t:CDS:2 [Funneliformis geosporum]|uniref:12550_t:CDS:1 n=1 Tax=Funneliformis geosporum TaxID=1117311 RepID=A0A9W4SXE4_9GLOM|nr:4660_t:CDS:2 [Funneliformis geosporum]CAI2184862.1 12550_t:CDS:2 [Funneliformis geosporum]